MNLIKNSNFFLKTKANNLPKSPGVYIMKNSKKIIIYIGKSKELKNRVTQYFGSNTNHSDKVKQMVSQIEDFEYIITDSEFEALILECSLIKHYLPKYNILLKDDKGFNYIKITNSQWPRVLAVTQKLNDNSTYFGPYTSYFYVTNIIEQIIKIFKIPTCNKNFNFKSRPCLNYHIKKCTGVCLKNISNSDYLLIIKNIILFLKKDKKEFLNNLNLQMQELSDKLNFERAAEIRDIIKSIKNMNDKQKVFLNNNNKEKDIISFVSYENKISVQILKFNNNNLYKTENFLIENFENITKSRTEFIERYYSFQDNIPENIILDSEIENFELIKQFLIKKSNNKNIKIFIPKSGENLKLIEMCKNNASQKFTENKEFLLLEELKNILNLKNLPKYIEAYDVSNLNGSENVGGMVVFKDGKKYKSDYKKFKIKNVFHQDDYNSIKEILSRRIKNYKNSVQNFEKLPDLILIDGGITHTRAAQQVLDEENIKIPVFGMVKNRKHRTRALTDINKEINIKINNIFNFITKIQDEVHRFTIGYHRNLRNKKIKTSELTQIPNIGEKRAKILLTRFGGVERISNTSLEELILIPSITKSCAESIIKYFNKNI